MTDEPTERAHPETEPVELSGQDIDLIVEALRYLQSTLGREEADQIERIQEVLAKLGGSVTVGNGRPRF